MRNRSEHRGLFCFLTALSRIRIINTNMTRNARPIVYSPVSIHFPPHFQLLRSYQFHLLIFLPLSPLPLKSEISPKKSAFGCFLPSHLSLGLFNLSY